MLRSIADAIILATIVAGAVGILQLAQHRPAYRSDQNIAPVFVPGLTPSATTG